MAWHDARLIENILAWEDGKSLVAGIFQRLRERRLFKRVFQRKIVDFPPALRTQIPNDNERRARRSRIEERIAEMLSRETNSEVPAHFTILHYYKIESVRKQSRNSERSILISDGANSPPISFEDVSTLFRSIDDQLKDEMLEVYAPVEYRDEAEKRRLLRKCDEEIRRIIEDAMTCPSEDAPENPRKRENDAVS